MAGFNLTPVDGDPFAPSPTVATAASSAGSASAAPFKLEPVEGDPFEAKTTTPAALGDTEPKPSPGVLASGLAGVNTGLIADTLGAVTGIPTALANAIIANPADPKWHLFENPLPAEWWNKQLGKIGIGTEAVIPQTEAEKIAQGAGRGAGQMLATALPGKAEIAASEAAGATASPLGKLAGEGSVAGQAALGAAGGAGGQAGKDIAPAGYEQAGEMIGNLAGGIIPAGAAAGAVGLARGAEHAYGAIPPLTATSREAVAGDLATRALERSAADPNAAFEALYDRVEADNAELIPGSRSTTAEIANDPGLATLERTRSRQNPEMATAVSEQRAENNEARVRSLSGMAPETASPEAAQAVLRQHLQNIDNLGVQNLEAARTGVENTFAPANTELARQEGAAQTELTNAIHALGGTEALGTPEERAAAPAAYGAAMRDPAQTAYLAERQRLDDLREAIDPSGTMGIAPAHAKAAVADIVNTFKPEGGAIYSGAERHLYDTVNGWGDLIPIEQAFQLRANINGRLAQAMDHSPQEAKRLLMLKNGVDESLSDAVGGAHAIEQQEESGAGVPPIEQRIAGLAQTPGMGPSFIQDVARAYTSNPTALRAARRDETGRDILEAADRQSEPIRTGAVAGDGGAGGDENGGSRGGASGAGVPQEPLIPLTDEARERFAQWNQDYAAMKRQFQGETAGKLHAVGKMLQKGGAYDSFRLADGEVPWLFVDGGKTAKEGVQRFLAATPPEAHQALDNAFSFSLRRAAQNPDTGMLDLPKYNKWLTAHEAALSERPDLLNQFNTAAKAQRRLNDIKDNIADLQKAYSEALKGAEKGAVDDHLAARGEFTKSVAGQFIGDDADKAVARVFSGPDRTQKAQTLMRLLAGNRAAVEGLQRAAIDHIIERYSGSAMAGAESGYLKPQMLQNFIAANRNVLDVLFPNGLARNFDALSEDLRRSQLVPNAKLPGGSDTMQLQNAALPFAERHENGSLSTIGAALVGERLGEHLGHALGPVGAVAMPLTMRWLKGKSGALQLRANQMLDQMLLDPRYAVAMRDAYPAKGPIARPAVLNRFAARVAQTSAQAARAQDLTSPQHRAGYKRGGSVALVDAVRSMSTIEQGKHLAGLLDKYRNSQKFADGGGVVRNSDARGLALAAQGAHLADLAETSRKQMSDAAEAAVAD